MQRPDLSNIDPLVVDYIEYLEKKAGLRAARPAGMGEPVDLAPERANEALPAERETSANIILITHEGLAKRTQRHLFTRQHRGGMGAYGIDIDAPDFPVLLANAEENQNLLFFTNRARVFRQSINLIASLPVYAPGSSIVERFQLEAGEKIVTVLAEQARGYVAMVSEGGRVRSLRHHLFGEHMRQGTSLFNANDFGDLASACWTPGDAEIFLVTRQGIGIRFAEKSISPQDDMGIKVRGDDKVAAIASVYPDSGVLMVSADGRGAIRQMSGFAANKSPGGSGKIAIKSSKVAGAVTVEANDDVFIITQLGKLIRFPVDEIPPTEGVVQGVNCMGLRGDEVVALLRSGPIY